MARAKKPKGATAPQKLLTLTEVAKKTGISMPTLQRYKKTYQSRIPSEGKGRKQRYPAEALSIFEEIKKENLGRRGRPRKGTAAADRKPAAARKPAASRKRAPKAAGGGELLTLSEIGRLTGISYPTLVRYVKLFLDQIPHEGSGRKRRFHSEAVAVFQRLRGQSKRGRRKKSEGAPVAGARFASGADAALSQRIRTLESAQAEISRQLEQVIETLKKPLQVTITSR